MTGVPATTAVLVIGGGPAGSTAAALLARQGIDVTLLERTRFPRYHIGESLLPSILQILDLLGAREKMERIGFQRKQGALLEWGPERWGLDFGELAGNCTYAYQVERAAFDQMLLEHAADLGVHVVQEAAVESLEFTGGRPTGAVWVRQAGDAAVGNGEGGDAPRRGETAFGYLIDASGRSGVMATKYLQNRRYHKVFQNVALWGYWKHADRLATGREGDIAVASISDGWLWSIPLRDDTTSVGVVVHRDSLVARSGSIRELYFRSIAESPFIQSIVERGTLASDICTEQDYSYASQRFCGDGYFMVGDAACFLDPLLSSGVHLATYSGLLAAASIGSTLRGEVTAGEASLFFERCYRQAYLRFLVFLSAFYDVGRRKESYFWEAQRLTEEDADAGDLKRAFLKLVTGVKDMSDLQTDAHGEVLEIMAKRIDENLTLRRDKAILAALEGESLHQARANGRFFTSVEGLFALSEEEAIDGLYVATDPYVRLARTNRSIAAARKADLPIALA